MKLYLAYGANTNSENMSTRCPEARYICNVTLNHHRLVFRGVADLVPARSGKVVCAMWLISPKDEAALDRFEGFPRTYVKRYVTIQLQGRKHRVMFYVMRARYYEAEPSNKYQATLRKGYTECGMPLAQIDAAISHAAEWRRRHAPVEVHHGKWADQPESNDLPQTDAEADAEAADQFMFDWYNSQPKE